MQPQTRAHRHPAQTPLTDMLGRVGVELGDLATAVEALHPLVAAQAGQKAAPARAPDLTYVQALQNLDHIEQKLRALAGFLADLTRTAQPTWQLDPQPALAAITLSDLASRLAGNQPQDHNATAGECELF